jgi:hypothetical protein
MVFFAKRKQGSFIQIGINNIPQIEKIQGAKNIAAIPRMNSFFPLLISLELVLFIISTCTNCPFYKYFIKVIKKQTSHTRHKLASTT